MYVEWGGMGGKRVCAHTKLSNLIFIDIVFLGLSNKLSLVRLKTYKLYYFYVVFIIFTCDNK